MLRESWVGVDLFFAISGYVVTHSLLRLLPAQWQGPLGARLQQSVSALKIFYTRRAFRIIPLLVCWMLLHVALTLTYQHRFPDLVGNVPKILHEDLWFFTGVFNYLRDNTAYQGQFWSLSVEEHFYLLFPFLLVAITQTRGRALAIFFGIALIAFVVRPLIPHFTSADEISFLSYTSHRRFDTLLVGAFLAIWRPASGYLSPLRLLYPFISVASVALLWSLPALVPASWKFEWGFSLYALVAGFLIHLASFERGVVFSIPYVSRALEYIGSRSYGIYLAHVPMIRLYLVIFGGDSERTGSGAVSSILSGLALFIATILVAEITYRWVELPFIACGKSISKKWNTQREATQ